MEPQLLILKFKLHFHKPNLNMLYFLNLFVLLFTLVAPQGTCQSTNAAGICQRCLYNMELFEDNTCRLTEKIEGCQVYSTKDNEVVCGICADDHYMEKGVCRRNLANCKEQAKTGKCDKCVQGYVMKRGQCVRIKSTGELGIKNCAQYSNQNCLRCNSNFVLNNGRCYDNPTCNRAELFKGCLFESGGICQNCLPGYKLEGSRCTLVTLPNCLKVQNNSCTQCDLFYQIQNGKCLKIRINHCISSRLNSLFCLQCSPGYTLTQNICKPNPNFSPITKSSGTLYYKSTNLTIVTTDLEYRIQDRVRRCLQRENGLCIKCSKTFYRNYKSQCKKRLDLLPRASSQSTYTTSDNRTFKGGQCWNPKKNGEWVEMRWKSVKRFWGVQFENHASIMTGQLFLVQLFYELQNGQETCYRNCKPINLQQFSFGIFHNFSLPHSIRTRSIRILILKMTGAPSVKLEAYVFSIEDLPINLASENSFLESSKAINFSLPLLKINSTNPYRLANNNTKNQYVGFKLKGGSVRVRKIQLQAGSNKEYVTSFVVKHSFDGKKYFCVDKCKVYQGITDPNKLLQITLQSAFYTRYLVIIPKTWFGWPSLRLQLLYDRLVFIIHCLQYNKQGRCRRCPQIYANVKGICRAAEPGCAKIDSSGVCQSCIADYFMTTEKKCQMERPGCVYSNNSCVSCVEGWRFANRQCTLMEDRMVAVPTRFRVKSADERYVGVEFDKMVSYYYLELLVGANVKNFSIRTSANNKQFNQIRVAWVRQETSKGARIVFLKPLRFRGIRIYLGAQENLNLFFEAYYYQEPQITPVKPAGKWFSQVGFLTFSKIVDISQVNPKVDQGGCFTLPMQDEEYMGFSIKQDDSVDIDDDCSDSSSYDSHHKKKGRGGIPANNKAVVRNQNQKKKEQCKEKKQNIIERQIQEKLKRQMENRFTNFFSPVVVKTNILAQGIQNVTPRSATSIQLKTVTIKNMVIKGSEALSAWVTEYYLKFSKDGGKTFQCLDDAQPGKSGKSCRPVKCKVQKTNLTNAKQTVTIPYSINPDLTNITDIRFYAVNSVRAKSFRIDFDIV